MRALVVGGGSWGTAFAGVLARAGHPVELACRDARAVADLQARRENSRYLPGVRIEDAGRVEVVLRLPTFWCAPNFAYLMAYDAREQALRVSGVREVRVVGRMLSGRERGGFRHRRTPRWARGSGSRAGPG